MQFFNTTTTKLLLSLALVVSTPYAPAFAAPNRATKLKFGEVHKVARSSAYSAASLFALTLATPEQRALILSKLATDFSAEAFNALAEISAQTPDEALAKQTFEMLLAARPASGSALRMLALITTSEPRREAAAEAVRNLPYVQAAPAANGASNFEVPPFAKQILKDATEDIRTRLSVSEDLTDGSRYLIQTWFLKKVLSLQNASETERRLRFDALINEISVFLSKPVTTVKIATKDDLEKFKSSLESPFAYLHDEMKFSTGLTSLSPMKFDIAPSMIKEVQALSKAFHKFDQKIEALNGTYLFDLFSNREMAGLLFRFRLKTQLETEKVSQLRLISDEFAKQYKNLKTVAHDLVEQKVIQFSNPAEQRFFELMIAHYFSTFTFEETANVMKAVFERPDKQSSHDLFHLMVMYADPQMQKLLQVVSRRPGISKELSETFKRLEDAGLPSPWERVGANFAKPPRGTEWVSLDRKAFVGSMAQTYPGVVRYPDGREIKIAARTLKSDIHLRVEKEIPRLKELARVLDRDPLLREYNFPLVQPAMDDVMQMARDEENVKQTTENQIAAQPIYEGTRKLSNGAVLKFVTPDTLESEHPEVIYSTWLEGEKFEDFVKKHPALGLEVAELTAFHWIENALFKQRFFNSDLHQGNMKVLNSTKGQLTVGIFDFGMVGRVLPEERSTIIKLALATRRNKNAALIARYLWDLSDKSKNTITLEELKQSARDFLKSTPDLKMEYWMAWSLSKGLGLPKNITAFSRGIGAIEQLTSSSGSKKELEDMVKSVALRHTLELAPDLVRYLRDAVVSGVSETARKMRAPAPNVALAHGFGPTPLTCQDVFGH